MKIINRVTDKNYTQWIEDFVKNVIIYDAHISCNEIIIDDIEPNKRIFLLVDGQEYNIRTWNYHPIDTDNNGMVCKEMVVYTLFKIIPCKGGSCGEEVIEGHIKIEWDNSLMED